VRDDLNGFNMILACLFVCFVFSYVSFKHLCFIFIPFMISLFG
jgi:hypothetical protein